MAVLDAFIAISEDLNLKFSHSFAHAYKCALAPLLENLLRSFVLNSYYLLYIMLLLLLLQPPLPSKKSERILSDSFEGRGGCTQASCPGRGLPYEADGDARRLA